MTRVQKARRYVKLRAGEVNYYANMMERRMRRRTKAAIRAGKYESIPHRPGEIDYFIW